MRVALMSDIHDRYKEFDPKEIATFGIDYIFCAGDITNEGNRNYIRKFYAEKWVSEMSEIAPFYYIPGNHDIGFRVDAFPHCVNAINVNGSVKKLSSDLTISGVSLSGCYDFPALKLRWDFMTDDFEVEKLAFDIEKVSILLSHSPPYKVMDEHRETSLIKNLGSKALYEYILTKKPGLVVCGHIHDNVGYRTIEDTLVINTAEAWTIVDFNVFVNGKFTLKEIVHQKKIE